MCKSLLGLDLLQLKVFQTSILSMPKKKTKQELTIPVKLAEQLNQILGELHTASEDAIKRMQGGGAQDFRSTNYRNALTGLEAVINYVRGFAGASATAHIEDLIDEVLESYEKEVVADTVRAFGAEQTKRKKKKS